MTTRTKQLPAKASIYNTPTTSAKMAYVGSQAGINLNNQQGSSRMLFDTVIMPTVTTGQQSVTFFLNASTKAPQFSNLSGQSTLLAGEALTIEEVRFVLATLSAADLTLPSTQITNIAPISAAQTLTTLPFYATSTFSISIANKDVVKPYPLIETNPSYNRKNTSTTLGYSPVAIGSQVIEMEAPPVILPNVQFSVTLNLSANGVVAANTAIICYIGRFGSILSLKQNF